LPIPRTGIVPANRDRVADALGRVIATNFPARRTTDQKRRDRDSILSQPPPIAQRRGSQLPAFAAARYLKI
jgi:hypothetical protein